MLLTSALIFVAVASSDGSQEKSPPAALWVGAEDPRLMYYGRIGFEDPKAASFYYAGTGFKFRFKGRSLALRFAEDGYGPANSFGVRIDGSPEIPIRLIANTDQTYVAAVGLPDRIHEVDVYRRQDCYGGVAQFKGIYFETGSRLENSPKRPVRKIEFFGDSVMGGSASIAFGYEARQDGAIQYNNSDDFINNGYWGFGTIAARLLKADANVQGIGGLPLLDHTGWFGGSLENTVGLVTTWDKLNPLPNQQTPWDFSWFTPDVVVISIGQNDARGGNIHDPQSREKWIKAYLGVLEGLRSHYPKALFVLTTTILMHDLEWDKAIQEVASKFCQVHGADQARYFAFKRTAKGTPGHPRIIEEEEMARELADYLDHLPGLWGRY